MDRTFIFDLDGTLAVRRQKNWEKEMWILWLEYNGIKNPLKILNNPEWKERSRRMKLLGVGMDQYKEWYENFAVIEYKNNIAQAVNGNINLADGAHELLQAIPGAKFLVSNACKEWINYAVDAFKIRNYFDYIFEREYRFGEIRKPEIGLGGLLCEKAGIGLVNPIMVGDTSQDRQFARNLGCEFICVYNEAVESDFYFSDIMSLGKNIRRFL